MIIRPGVGYRPVINYVFQIGGRCGLGVVSKKKKKLMEFSIKGPDPPSQPLNGKKTWSKNALNHLK